MPDISMCKGNSEEKVCPLRESCYRFTAVPSEFRQSYFTEIPFEARTESCTYYWNDFHHKDKGNLQ